MKKQYILFKKSDFLVQLTILSTTVLLILASLLGAFSTDFDFRYVFYSYYVVGGFQLVSFLLNWFIKGIRQSKLRVGYAWTLLVLLALLIPPVTFIGLYALLFFSPALAIYYVYTCYSELRYFEFFY